jgi:hypothetical protein
LNCGERYQHPSSFESHIALDFYKKNLTAFFASGRLTEILLPAESFDHKDTNGYRNWLMRQYAASSIKIYDFVSAKYICPHCGKMDSETAHDLFHVSDGALGEKYFKISKRNAVWGDFESLR